MNISYQREMKRNYLIVETEKRDEIPFEQNMLEQNQIDGVLHFQVRKKDTDIRFFYCNISIHSAHCFCTLKVLETAAFPSFGRAVGTGRADPDAGEGNCVCAGAYGAVSAE